MMGAQNFKLQSGYFMGTNIQNSMMIGGKQTKKSQPFERMNYREIVMQFTLQVHPCRLLA